MKFELLDEKLEIERNSERGKWAQPLQMFLKSGKGTILFSCANDKERKNGIAAIGHYNKTYNLGLVYGRYQGNKIYVVRGN